MREGGKGRNDGLQNATLWAHYWSLKGYLLYSARGAADFGLSGSSSATRTATAVGAFVLLPLENVDVLV